MPDNVIEFRKGSILQKNLEIESFEIKSDGEEKTIEGYMTTFGNKDSYNDVIVKGAFGKVKPYKVKFLWQHDWKEPIGTIEQVKEDDNGVWFKAKFSDFDSVPTAKKAYTLLKDGAIDGISIGFRIDKFKYEDDGSRLIEKGSLMEASVVTFPANDMATVTAVKGFGEEGKIEKRDFEEMLRHFGFSQKESCIIVSKAYPALESHWDGDCEEKDNQSDSDLNERAVKALDDLLKELKGNKND